MKKKWFWGTLLVVVVAVLFAVNVIRLNHSIPVRLVHAEKGEITEKIFAAGKIESAVTTAYYLQAGGNVAELSLKVGDFVRKGQTLLKLDTSDLERQLQMEQNNLKLIENDKNAARKQSFEQFRQHTLEGADTSDDEADLSLYDLKIENARLSMEGLRQSLKNSELTAEHDGVVTELNVKQGQMAQAGARVLVVTDVSRLQVRANLNELDANRVRPGMEAKVTGDAFDTVYDGKVTYLSPVAALSDPTSKDPSIELLVSVDHPEGDIRPGYSATIEMTIHQPERILVPLTAVVHDGDRAFVFKAVDNKAVKVEVETGKVNDEQVEILSGLSDQEPIISEATDRMMEGKKVKVQ